MNSNVSFIPYHSHILTWLVNLSDWLIMLSFFSPKLPQATSCNVETSVAWECMCFWWMLVCKFTCLWYMLLLNASMQFALELRFCICWCICISFSLCTLLIVTLWVWQMIFFLWDLFLKGLTYNQFQMHCKHPLVMGQDILEILRFAPAVHVPLYTYTQKKKKKKRGKNLCKFVWCWSTE